VSAAVAARPGRAGDLFDALSHDHEVFLAETPDEIRNLRDLLLLPELLAAALALVGTAGLVHAVVTGHPPARRDPGRAGRAGRHTAAGAPHGRRARRGHRAARAAGRGCRWASRSGRVLWWEIATGTGVAGDVALPGPLLVGLAPGGAAGRAAGGGPARAARHPHATRRAAARRVSAQRRAASHRLRSAAGRSSSLCR
jgi:hypothetical protein